jgi:hypothetical protein
MMLEQRSSVERRFPLRAHSRVSSSADGSAWRDAIEDAVQRTMKTWFDPNEGRDQLPSVHLLKNLSAIAQERVIKKSEHGSDSPPELLLFATPRCLFQFRVHDWKYVSMDVDLMDAHTILDQQKKGECLRRIDANRKAIGLVVTDLRRELRDRLEQGAEQRGASFEEILAVLIDQLYEDCAAPQNNGTDIRTTGPELPHPVAHPARVAAIQSWERRMVDRRREECQHSESVDAFVYYPYVALERLTGEHLVALVVTPLDPTFVDDKVADADRACEIALGIYDGTRLGDWEAAALPLFRQALARVIFTTRASDVGRALVASFEDLGKLTRYWYTKASDGLFAAYDRDTDDLTFDGIRFGEGIVKRLLCRIEGVENTEVCPFDRVYIFREAGTSGVVDYTPMEVLVLEASIKSENPADRGQSLTRWQRLLREREDFECRAAEKTVQDDDRFQFFVHRHGEGLVLSTKRRMEDRDIADALNPPTGSKGSAAADARAYEIRVDSLEDARALPTAVINLFGRMLPKAHVNNEFERDFEKLHLTVLQRAGEDGLHFIHAHGLNLREEVPLLHALQNAYFDYLQALRGEEDKGELEKRLGRLGDVDAQYAKAVEQRKRGSGRAQVLFVSFSGELHDPNTLRYRQDLRRALRERKRRPDQQIVDPAFVLGPEYAFTMIFVSDREPDKTRPQLQRERVDLKTVFQMMIRQIWMARLNERQFLQSRSRSIGAALQQFMHTVKGYVPDEANKRVLVEIVEHLQQIIRPERAKPEWLEFASANEILQRIRGTKDDIDALLAVLQKEMGYSLAISVQLIPSYLPRLQVLWSDAVVQDAFRNALKNACEAAAAAQNGDAGEVSVSVVALPDALDGTEGKGFLDLTLVNTGGPIPAPRLETLNAANPSPLQADSRKRGSTGVGVFVSRYQLREVIGQRADLIIQNVADDRVETHLRLPVKFLKTDFAAPVPEVEVPRGDYVLLVEDIENEGTREMFRGLQTHFPDWTVCWARTSDVAAEYARNHVPVLLISDYNIPYEEGGDAAGKFGESWLAEFLRIAGHQPPARRPPVWVLTGEGEHGVQGDEIRPVEHGYQRVTCDWSNPESMAAAGTFCVLNVKYPFKHAPDAFGTLLKVFSDRLKLKHERQAIPPGLAGSDPPGPVRRLALGAEPLEAALEPAFEQQRAADELIVVVEATIGQHVDLAEALVAWFGHPGLPDLDYLRRGQGKKRYPLWSGAHHTRLLLLAPLGALFDRALPRLLYWGLCHNLVMVRRRPTDREIWSWWSRLRKENRGPISKLRHDVGNEWASPGLESCRERVVELTHAFERCVGVPGAGCMLEDALAKHDGIDRAVWSERVAAALVATLVNPDEAGSKRLDVARKVEEIQVALREGRQLAPKLAASIDRHLQTVQVVGRLVGGEG